MSDLQFRPGQAVDPKKAVRWGSLRVAEYRIYSMSKWMGSVIAYGLGNPILYLVSVGLGIGALVDANSDGQGVLGVSYLQFVAPALLAAAAIQGVMDEVTFPTMDGFIWDKLFYAINATSVSSYQIANGVMLAALARGTFTVSLYLAVLVAFAAIPLSSIFPLLLTSLFAAWAWSTVMLAVTARLERDEGYFAIIGRFVIAPMFLFSGTFYPLQLMPIYLQPIGWVSPFWHSAELGRTLSYGAEMSAGMFAIHVSYLLFLVVVGLLFTYPKFKQRLAK